MEADPRSPAVQLRRYLAEAKILGVPFQDAWTTSLLRVKWPHDTAHRIGWKEILGDAKEYETPLDTLTRWQAAYESRPAMRRDRPLQALIAA